MRPTRWLLGGAAAALHELQGVVVHVIGQEDRAVGLVDAQGDDVVGVRGRPAGQPVDELRVGQIADLPGAERRAAVLPPRDGNVIASSRSDVSITQ